MKIYCITGNPDIEIGLKLAGCQGITIKENDSIEDKIKQVIENKEIGILVISKSIYEKETEMIDKIKFSKKVPLITII